MIQKIKERLNEIEKAMETNPDNNFINAKITEIIQLLWMIKTKYEPDIKVMK